MLVVIALGFFEHSPALSAYSQISASREPMFHLKDFLTMKNEGCYNTSRSLHPDNVHKILIFPLHFPSCPSLKLIVSFWLSSFQIQF